MLKKRFLRMGRTMSQTDVTLGNIIFDIGRHHRPKEVFSNLPQTTLEFLAHTTWNNQTRVLKKLSYLEQPAPHADQNRVEDT